MTIPAIPPSAPPFSAVDGAGQVKETGGSNEVSLTSLKKDVAVISDQGKDALAKHEVTQPAQAVPAKVLTNSDAALIGQGLQRSNPAHFKAYDTNGDGKLNAEEARAAGLG